MKRSKIDRMLFTSRRAEKVADVLMAVAIGAALSVALASWWAQ